MKQGQWLHNFFKTFILLTYKWIWNNFNLTVTFVLHGFQFFWSSKALIKLFLTEIHYRRYWNTNKLVSEKFIKFVSVTKDSRKSSGFFRKKKEKDILAY